MENKKRKLKDETSDDDELEAEMKMDKFYSLLRSFGEARDRRRKELEELDRKMRSESNKKSKITETIWVPSFESGDFTTEVEFRRPPLIFPSPSPSSTSTTTSPTPCDNRKGKKDLRQADDALDLSLSL